jgi:hypothetical protein
MGAIRILYFSRNTNAITLTLNSGSENAINLALLQTQGASNVSCGVIFTGCLL